jgi:DNA mismatch repair protein MutS2
VRLGDGYTALVITGPNTGGKTVTLRTLGLLSAMHQAGLHVPAEPGSSLPILRDVFADIGDEQSIAQSLSTFSGHLRAIVRIVESAGPNTLVLLDELGAGTDPTEGSALAQALLDHLIRAGALVAATTHYAELKAYAHNTPGARNAAVSFDLATLSPTFTLTIGLPGGSQAFAIAERLGLPDAIVADARSRLPEVHAALEETLASIRGTEEATAEALDRARAAEVKATDALRTAEDERRRARRERDETVRQARAEAERLVRELQDDVRATRRALERETLTAPTIDEALARADTRLAQIPEGDAIPTAPARAPSSWRIGDRVRSRTQGWEGRIAALERGGRRATLEAGGLRVTVALDDLEPLVPGNDGQGAGAARPGDRANIRSGPTESGGTTAAIRLERVRSVASSLDLRGARVEEALEVLARYLDDAALAGLDKVTIVHGLGTGALRDAVRAFAASHPLVRTVRAGERGEGGDGATIVEL